MADNVQLVVTLRKQVDDVASGRALLDLVKERFAGSPEILVTGHCVTHYESEATPP